MTVDGRVRERTFVRLTENSRAEARGAIATESPVAFVYSGRPHVVMMCTPDNLEDLAYGFSLTEGIVSSAAEIERVEQSKHEKGFELAIAIPVEAAARLAQRMRALAGRTGCGLCGVEAIDDAVRAVTRVSANLSITHDALWRAGEALDAHQPLNRETRAVHAAAWASSDGTLEVVREDVGRHNALDKVLGALARAGTDASAGFLVVTSRASFELIQKASAAGVALLAAVSRPTELAVKIADASGITLVGLLRGTTANIYSHPERVT
ncbi:MAG TPA: formate dehydrogenase accessory sulfurtransferase FdhD [Gemmatimonadaceae bacterium]|jgi:FdhD protein|nr:formate dehydrogenase accessory sulfurtransferase FdhD [Gemmatimonadaceae bacterium]